MHTYASVNTLDGKYLSGSLILEQGSSAIKYTLTELVRHDTVTNLR